MYCNKCGIQIPDDSNFCNKCGANQSSSVNGSSGVVNPYFDIRHGVLVKYTGREKNVVVPSGVIEIEKGAFDVYKLDSLTLPEGVKRATLKRGFVGTTLRLPSTMEECSFYGDSCWLRPVHKIYLAEGTKKISLLLRYERSDPDSYCSMEPIEIYIPKSVEELSVDSEHVKWMISGEFETYSKNIRTYIYRYKWLCQYCGGKFKDKKSIFGAYKYICENCGKEKDYQGWRW